MTLVYEVRADDFSPDAFVREAVEDGDLIAAATITLESYGWQLYNFIARQVQLLEIDEVFGRVADEILRGLPDLVVAAPRVRDWIYTLVHGAWIRTQACDPRSPLEGYPGFARWVQQMIAGFRSAAGLDKEMDRARAARVFLRVARRSKLTQPVSGIGSTSGGEPTLAVVGGGRLARGSRPIDARAMAGGGRAAADIAQASRETISRRRLAAANEDAFIAAACEAVDEQLDEVATGRADTQPVGEMAAGSGAFIMGGGSGLARELNTIAEQSIHVGRCQTRVGMERIAIQRVR